MSASIDSILNCRRDPFLIIRFPLTKIIKEDVGAGEIIKSGNWGQFHQAGQIKLVYPEFLAYADILEAIIDVYNNNTTASPRHSPGAFRPAVGPIGAVVVPGEFTPLNKVGQIENYKFNDGFISAILNIHVCIAGIGQVLIMTSKSDLIDYNGNLISPRELIEIRNTFTNSLGHEIKTPLTSILSLIELLGLTELNTKQRDYIGFLNSSSQLLLSLINDIMDYSKLDENKLILNTEVINLRTCIENSFNIVAGEFAFSKIEFLSIIDNNIPLDVIGDPLKITQILTNLVKNAAKFSNNDSKITVKLQAQPCTFMASGKYKYIFSVIDQGIGISPEDIHKLFIPYSQLNQNQARKKYGGTGLGLTIARKLTNLMGGDIYVESEVGKGSTFTFSIILETSPTKPVLEQADIEFASLMKNKKILIVDDTEAHRVTLMQMAHLWGVQAIVCATPTEALMMCDINKFDLGLIDYYMPGHMSGRELAFELNKRGHNFPIIVLSSLNENIVGPFTLMFKPISRDRLEYAIRRLLMPTNTGAGYGVCSVAGPSSGNGSASTHITSPAKLDFNNTQSKQTPIFVTRTRNNSNPTDLKTNIRTGSSEKLDRILVVDDYQPIKVSIVESLHVLGYTNTDAASDGDEAVRMVEKAFREGRPYKYVFMDIVMPYNGILATCDINKIYGLAPGMSPKGTRPKIIALSANMADNVKYKLPENGNMDYYIQKPTNINTLKSVLNKFK